MKRLLILPLALAAVLAGGATRVVQDQCGPFTDVTPQFCPYILELYYLGITAGTSATTYAPDDPLTRGQAAVFVAKGLDQSLARSSRRAALGQWWTTTPHWNLGLGATVVGAEAGRPASDGADVWVPAPGGTVDRVRASDGKLLETWTGADLASAACVAMGRVFVTGATTAGALYMIDPSAPAGSVTTVADNLGNNQGGGTDSVAFDGQQLWTTQPGTQLPPPPNSVAIVTPGTWAVQTITTGFQSPAGVVFDGSSIWVADNGANSLFKLDSSGGIVQTVPTGINPAFPVFDGENIWVPNFSSSSITVVRASTGSVIATLSGNGLAYPSSVAFDGRRILAVSGPFGTVSLWDAQTLTPLGNFDSGLAYGSGVCSDGVNFWITFFGFEGGRLVRF